ncbi:helical backbone metal receptor [Actinomycetospora sp. OC33-EN08]|uniref:Helical backbone metal receptor n=1 Tax=Actinomycetospora aurantiaca TaxID=3129233 RepID=A0ABU8MPM7_9PSEU
MSSSVDDQGTTIEVPEKVRRVVSLVPSLTEAIGVTEPSLLVGVTDWCTHPTDLDEVVATPPARIRGTKNPDLDAIVALEPDLVVANDEENKPEHVAALRDAGLAVFVTDVRTVDGAFTSLDAMLAACGLERPAWLEGAEKAWAAIERVPDDERRTALIPIWRKPWMAVGCDTFTGAVLDRLGVDNLLADGGPGAERYPRFDPADLGPHDLVVLPDEPYRFTADDGPEAFDRPAALVSGRLLTWYGPSLLEAATTLPGALRLPVS